ncbi:MAG: AraC family transcriptional regulator [Bacteroidota bacterium]
MKAKFEKISIDEASSIKVYDFQNTYFDAPWHFHPEYELTLILKSKGKRYVGNSISGFSPGDLVLVGPNLPHIWKNSHAVSKSKRSHAIVIHFTENFTNSNFFEYDEMRNVKGLLDDSKFGLTFDDATVNEIKPLIKNLPSKSGFEMVLSFLEVLHKLSISKKITRLNRNNFLPNLDINSSKRINTVCEYIYSNYKNTISLKKLADLAGMTENAFSRYFKNHVGISISKFIIQVRMNQACFLLIETDLTVAEICYECGYNSISNFNKRFKGLIKLSPTSFRNKHYQKL